MKVNGSTINNMAMVKRLGRIDLPTKATLSMAKSMARVTSNGQMALTLQVSVSATVFTEEGFTLGTTDADTMASGETTK